jgi:hypothetical protein
MHPRLAVVVVVLASLACPSAAAAQRRITNDTLAFWVIGRDASTRERASQWIERTMRSTTTRPPVPMLDWQRVLPRLLDVDPPGTIGDTSAFERRSGPAVPAERNVPYPWDMTTELSVAGMIERLHDERMGVVVQVVVSRYSEGSGSASDSVYSLEALAIAEKGLGAVSKRIITLTTSSGSVEDRSLREASRQLGERLAAMWADMKATGPVRAR